MMSTGEEEKQLSNGCQSVTSLWEFVSSSPCDCLESFVCCDSIGMLNLARFLSLTSVPHFYAASGGD